jgi:DNA invertase Pin-like site-specific DNA recombinase
MNFLFHPQMLMLTLLSFTSPYTRRNSSEDNIMTYQIDDLGGDGPRIAAYTRVSSKKQVSEGVSLEVQRDEIEDMKKRFNPSKIYWFEDAGKTGTTFQGREIEKIQEFAESGHIDELWVTEIDRLGRDCRKLLIYCLKLCEDGVVIRTPNRAYQLGDLAGLLSLFLQAHGAEEENRKRAERAVASKARNFKMRHWNKPVPLGYEITNNWIVKNKDWTPIIKDIFRLFLRYRKIGTVCREINRKYRGFFGESQMTRYRIRRFLSDQVYIGKPKHLDQIVEDPSLRFIDEELSLEVQKILDIIQSRHQTKGDGINELVDKYGISVFGFLNQIEIRHRKCGGKLVKNGTRTSNGIKRYTYLCKACGVQFLIPTNSHLNHIDQDKENNSTFSDQRKKSNNISRKNAFTDQISNDDRKVRPLNSAKLSDFFK